MSDRTYADDLRAAADRIGNAPELLAWFKDHLGSDFSDAYFLSMFAQAFGIPLTILQKAIEWYGLLEGEHLDDESLEELLAPWVWGDHRGRGPMSRR